jgi:hypothetical protein
MSAAVDLQEVSEDFTVGILNILDLVRNLSEECHPLKL